MGRKQDAYILGVDKAVDKTSAVSVSGTDVVKNVHEKFLAVVSLAFCVNH